MDDLSDEENELEDLVRWSIVILVGFHACIMREIFFLLKKKTQTNTNHSVIPDDSDT